MSGSPFAGLGRKTSVRAVAFGLMVGPLIASLASNADARHREDAAPSPPMMAASPALAPFQHVRFCQRYPSDCKSNPAEADHIELNAANSELLKSVNRDVNATIVSTVKSYGAELADGWTIAPSMGDCNDYAVTKRHVLLQRGLPAKALRLSAVRTSSGEGHLVLLVVTTKGELVLDNLTDAIRPWRSTDYRWLKIQSASDARFWLTVKTPGRSVSQDDRKVNKPPA